MAVRANICASTSRGGSDSRGPPPPGGALRRGWTTGACATAATKAAYTALLTGEFPDPVTNGAIPPLWQVTSWHPVAGSGNSREVIPVFLAAASVVVMRSPTNAASRAVQKSLRLLIRTTPPKPRPGFYYIRCTCRSGFSVSLQILRDPWGRRPDIHPEDAPVFPNGARGPPQRCSWTCMGTSCPPRSVDLRPVPRRARSRTP